MKFKIRDFGTNHVTFLILKARFYTYLAHAHLFRLSNKGAWGKRRRRGAQATRDSEELHRPAQPRLVVGRPARVNTSHIPPLTPSVRALHAREKCMGQVSIFQTFCNVWQGARLARDGKW